jgi:hypothetical protein
MAAIRIRTLLTAEAEQHHPDRSAIYRKVVDASAASRRGLHRRRYGHAGPARVSPKMIFAGAGVAAAVGMAAVGASVYAGIDADGGPPTALTAPADPAGPASRAGSGGAPEATGGGARLEAGPAGPASASPTAGAVAPPTGSPTSPSSPPPAGASGDGFGRPPSAPDAGTAAPPDGRAPPPARPATPSVTVSPDVRPFPGGSGPAFPTAGSLDWVLFGSGGDGVFTRSAAGRGLIGVDPTARSPAVRGGYRNGFSWRGGVPFASGADYDRRLLLRGREALEVTLHVAPGQVRRLDLYVGALDTRLRVSARIGDGGHPGRPGRGGDHDGGSRQVEQTLGVPGGGAGRAADGIVRITVRAAGAPETVRIRLGVAGIRNRGAVVRAAAAVLY